MFHIKLVFLILYCGYKPFIQKILLDQRVCRIGGKHRPMWRCPLSPLPTLLTLLMAFPNIKNLYNRHLYFIDNIYCQQSIEIRMRQADLFELTTDEFLFVERISTEAYDFIVALVKDNWHT